MARISCGSRCPDEFVHDHDNSKDHKLRIRAMKSIAVFAISIMLVSSLAVLSPNVIAAHATPQPQIVISPTSGHSGTDVTVRGSGFFLRSTVSITFDGDSVDTSPERIIVKLDRTFSAVFVVPSTGGEGDIEVTATDNSIFRNSASTNFQQTKEDVGGSPGEEEEEVTDDPAARSQSVKIAEDTTTLVRLRASPQSDDIRFVIVDDPLHGTLSDFDSNLGTVLYTPNENYFGADKFTFRVQGSNVVGTVSITIEAINDRPTAKSLSIETVEDSSIQITLSGSDVESGDAITFAIVNKPAYGKLSGTAPNVTYTPDKDYFGFDSFTFRTSDGVAASELATVTIKVTGVNDPPIVDELSNIFIKENDDIRITLVAMDIDSKSVSFSIVSGPEHGTLTKPMTIGPMVAIATYTPDQNFVGKDAFTFLVDDGSNDNGISRPGKVSISVGTVSGSIAELAGDIDQINQLSSELPSSEGTSDNSGTDSDDELPTSTSIRDTTPPRLNIPSSPIEVQATSEEGAVVIYATAAADDADGVVPPLCSPASGSVFLVGKITVRCSATDSAGNGVEKAFMVSVMPFEGGGYPKIDSTFMIPVVVIACGAIATVVMLIRSRGRSQLNEEASSSLSDSPALPPGTL